MEPLLIVSLGIALVAIVSAAVVFTRLRATRTELERTRRRVHRLEEIADDVADREFEIVSREFARRDHAPESRVEVSDDLSEDSEELFFPTATDSGEFTPVGLQFTTDDVVDEEEEEFAAPRMTREVVDEPKQQPGRARHRTPTGSPRSDSPSNDSFMEVGSIQVRSDYSRDAPEG